MHIESFPLKNLRRVWCKQAFARQDLLDSFERRNPPALPCTGLPAQWPAPDLHSGLVQATGQTTCRPAGRPMQGVDSGSENKGKFKDEFVYSGSILVVFFVSQNLKRFFAGSKLNKLQPSF